MGKQGVFDTKAFGMVEKGSKKGAQNGPKTTKTGVEGEAKPKPSGVDLAAIEGSVPEMPTVDPEMPTVAPESLERLDSDDYGTDPRVEVREALSMLVVHWPDLPLPVTLHCAQFGVRFAITTSKSGYEAALDEPKPVFVGGELKCIAIAVESGRFRSPDMRVALVRKAKTPRMRITPEIAFDGEIPQDANACTLRMGDLMDALGIAIESLELHG